MKIEYAMPFYRTCKALEKEGDFKMAMEIFWIFLWKNSKNILKLM